MQNQIQLSRWYTGIRGVFIALACPQSLHYKDAAYLVTAQQIQNCLLFWLHNGGTSRVRSAETSATDRKLNSFVIFGAYPHG